MSDSRLSTQTDGSDAHLLHRIAWHESLISDPLRICFFTPLLCRQELASTQLELQIRTAAMNARAEYGTAAHAAYKGGMTDPQAVENLQALLEAAEQEAAERYTLLTGARISAVDSSTASSPAESVDRCVQQPSS